LVFTPLLATLVRLSFSVHSAQGLREPEIKSGQYTERRLNI